LDAIRARAAGEDLRAEEKHEHERHAQGKELETHIGNVVCGSEMSSEFAVYYHGK